MRHTDISTSNTEPQHPWMEQTELADSEPDPPSSVPVSNPSSGCVIRGGSEPYLLRHRLSEHGVYRGRGLASDSDVIIKAYLEQCGGERFKSECRAQERLTRGSHRNVLLMREALNTERYIIFPFLDGESLETVLMRERRLCPEAVIDMALGIGKGLVYSHALGVIHRDIKPDNIMIHNGSSVIFDYDISVILETEPSKELANAGTACYTAPERWQSLPADHRVDIFSFGVVLYRAVTGVLPFDDETVTGIKDRILYAPLLLEAVPAAIAPILLKMLAKDPQERYSKAKEVVAALKVVKGRV